MNYRRNVGIDLHIHSTASDGTLSPSEIVSLAQNLNLGAIAITDHDTIQGSKEALALGMPSALKFLTGVEISVLSDPGFSFTGSFHLLGYSIKLDDPDLNQALDKLQDARKNRNPEIIRRLNDLGMDISLKEVIREFSEGQLGRPHIAGLMVKKGFVGTISEAFDKYLGKGRPAYVDKYRLGFRQAIGLILGAGGIPVLAHPVLLHIKDKDRFEIFVGELKETGLKGIEIYHSEHTPDLSVYYADVAARNGLLMTGGTDFHGSIKPDIKMGTGKGDLFIPYELYEDLLGFGKNLSGGGEVKNLSISGKNKKDQSGFFEFEKRIKYKFSNINILAQALMHSSFVNEQPDTDIKDNERLEFLGDAVLGLVIGHVLMRRYPDIKEGDLSRMRAALVNESQLAIIAQKIDLGSYIKLGKGEIQTNGNEKKSILSDAVEALIAAVYLDGGFDAAFRFINFHFSSFLHLVSLPAADHDYKSRIQELVQEKQNNAPVYRVTGSTGPDHDKTFRVQLKAFEIIVEGVGKSKKAAEQDAAKKALEILTKS